MLRLSLCFLLALPTFLLLNAQAPGGLPEPMSIGPGVSPPRLLHKKEPTYSHQAEAERIQGTVVLFLVVNDKGRTADIQVISSLGFGLDERARQAVEKWEFKPGMKDGKPVSVQATIEVNFRLTKSLSTRRRSASARPLMWRCIG